MRICVVTVSPHGLGGMQRHTHELVRGLVGVGHDVEVIAPRAKRRENRGKPGAVWRYVDVDRRKDRFGKWLDASFREFSRAHAERPFDVVHSESTSALGLVGRVGVPVVVKFHGNYVGLAKAHARRAFQGRPLREFKGFLSLTRFHFAGRNCWAFRDCEWMVPARQQFADTRLSHVMRAERGHVVPNGVDIDLFRPRPRPLRDEPVLVGVGRLAWQKGFDVAIRALVGIPGARLRILGDGNERASLERLASEVGVAQRVEFRGAQPPEEVAREVAQADIFLFPTRREEAAPLVLVEAMACGSPVIASKIGGIAEVIDRPGGNGVLVPFGDRSALAEAARRLLERSDERERLGAAARERVLAEYTLERMVERTLEVYERAADGSARVSSGRVRAGRRRGASQGST